MSKLSGRLNEQFIELMEKLANIMLKKGEQFKTILKFLFYLSIPVSLLVQPHYSLRQKL